MDDLQPKIEPIFDPNGHRVLKEVTVSEVVSVLRAEVDRVEEVLMARDAQHKAEIGPLQEKYEVERLMRLQAEQELKKKEEQCQTLRNKNSELEREKVELMGLKRKRVDGDSNVVAELRIRVAALENEKLELEDANKKNLGTIEKLTAENRRLARDEKKKTKKADEELLGNVCASVAGNTEGKPQAPLQRNIDTGHTLGASAESLEKRDKTAQNNLYRHDNESHIAARLDVQPHRVLRPRRAGAPNPHQRMEVYLRQAGFWEASHLGIFQYDSALISALVERWRPETHSFHLPYGECTITLQDVAFQFGLRVDGMPVSGCMSGWQTHLGRDIWTICEDLLGAVPGEEDRIGYTVNLKWFQRTFPSLGDDAPEPVVQQHTRAYILELIGRFLMVDKSSSRVHMKWLFLLEDFGYSGNLSWGSAVLATLYRNLCRAVKYSVTDIGGCMALLLSWAYYRIPMLRPPGQFQLRFPLASRWVRLTPMLDTERSRLVQYRASIDAIPIDGFNWTPYNDPSIVVITPEYVYGDASVWASVTALICFEIVEWHHVDRAVRQFGGQQHIPQAPLNIDRLHAKDGRGQEQVWWPTYHAEYHKYWDNRHDLVIQYTYTQDSRPSAEYFRWYSSIARRFLSANRVLQDPRQVELPDDVPTNVPPAPAMSQLLGAPDRRNRQCRLRAGTRASQRRYPGDSDTSSQRIQEERGTMPKGEEGAGDL